MGQAVKVREKWIDNAKGIAMILVIIGHVSGGLTGLWNFGWVYGVHLVMFFLLSGYTLKKKPLTKEYINNKFVRLMVPYFWTCLALSITNIWNSWYFSRDTSISTISHIIGKDVLISYFGSGSVTTFGAIDIGDRVGAIWFLPALFFSILILQILFRIKDDDLFLGVSTGAIAVLAFITARFFWFPFSIQSGMFASFFLWIGFEIKKQDILKKLKWYHYVTAQVILLLGIHFNYCNIGFVSANISDPWISIPVGLSGCLLIYLISVIDKGKILSYIGRISLTVLCVHLYTINTFGGYFNKIYDHFSLEGNRRAWANIILNVLFAVIVAAIIDRLQHVCKTKHENMIREFWHSRPEGKTNTALDIEQGIFISLLLAGYFPIDDRFRAIIYSCHIIVFIFIAGYRYGKMPLNKVTISNSARRYLIPYVCIAIVETILHHNEWHAELVNYIAGVSLTKSIFTNLKSVGPIYFLLVLFLCELLDAFIRRVVKSQRWEWIVIICISVFGMMLGNKGFWLPWSADIVCYSLVFYHLGSFCNEHEILCKISGNYISYFFFSSVWAYMIYCGGMELATRNYGQYGLVIMGAVSGTFVTFQLAQYIERSLPLLSRILVPLGRGIAVILSIHTVFHEAIQSFVSRKFSSSGTVYWGLVVLIELLIGLVITELFIVWQRDRKQERKSITVE